MRVGSLVRHDLDLRRGFDNCVGIIIDESSPTYERKEFYVMWPGGHLGWHYANSLSDLSAALRTDS